MTQKAQRFLILRRAHAADPNIFGAAAFAGRTTRNFGITVRQGHGGKRTTAVAAKGALTRRSRVMYIALVLHSDDNNTIVLDVDVGVVVVRVDQDNVEK
jgi:hypothetical protein